MDLIDVKNFWFFIVIFLPGFIAVKVNSLLIASDKYDFSKNILEIVGYSILNLLAFSWLINLNISLGWIYEENGLFLLSIFVVFILGPIILVVLTNRILGFPAVKKYVVSGSKSAWDFKFKKREPHWVRVHFKDGRQIGGKFANKSHASPYPCKENIFIEELWLLTPTGAFDKKADSNQGVLIMSDEISIIEFLK